MASSCPAMLSVIRDLTSLPACHRKRNHVESLTGIPVISDKSLRCERLLTEPERKVAFRPID